MLVAIPAESRQCAAPVRSAASAMVKAGQRVVSLAQLSRWVT